MASALVSKKARAEVTVAGMLKKTENPGQSQCRASQILLRGQENPTDDL